MTRQQVIDTLKKFVQANEELAETQVPNSVAEMRYKAEAKGLRKAIEILNEADRLSDAFTDW